MREALIADLKREEGWRPTLYKDSLGVDTVGYGFNVDPKHGGGMPQAVGEFWLEVEVDSLLAELPGRWPPFAEQSEDVQRALAQMAYQLGVPGLLKFKLMLAALERGDRETAAENALDSIWHDQTTARAERVAALIRGHQ